MSEFEPSPLRSPLPIIDVDIAEIAQGRYLSSSPTQLYDRLERVGTVSSEVETLLESGKTRPYNYEYLRAGLYSFDCVNNQLRRNGTPFPRTKLAIPLFQDNVKFALAIGNFMKNEKQRNPAFFNGLKAMINFQRNMLIGLRNQAPQDNSQLQELNKELQVTMIGGFVIPAMVYIELTKQQD